MKHALTDLTTPDRIDPSTPTGRTTAHRSPAGRRSHDARARRLLLRAPTDDSGSVHSEATTPLSRRPQQPKDPASETATRRRTAAPRSRSPPGTRPSRRPSTTPRSPRTSPRCSRSPCRGSATPTSSTSPSSSPADRDRPLLHRRPARRPRLLQPARQHHHHLRRDQLSPDPDQDGRDHLLRPRRLRGPARQRGHAHRGRVAVGTFEN